MARGVAMILDTCGLLWLIHGGKKLSPQCLTAIREASTIYVSAISGFEIATKAARGKLNLPKPANEWFKEAIEHFGLEILPVELDVCIAAAELPFIHADPCDRLIIAAAKLHGLKVVTSDENFEKYGVTVIS